MRLLVTGGMGFIGSNFIRYYLREHMNDDIVNIDALRYGSNPANLKDIENDGRYSFVKGDITNYPLVSEIVKDIDAVINFAAESHVDRSISSPEPFLQSNVIGVFTVLEALRKKNPHARMIQISTDEVYGDILEGSFWEMSALKPSSPYSASKAASDAFVMGYSRTYGLHAMITRCTNNFGPFQFPEKLIPKAIIKLTREQRIPIYGTGKNIRDWIYVQDHCRAVDCVLRGGKKGEIYNISSGNEMTNLEVVRAILRSTDNNEDYLEFVEDRPGHDVRYSLDSSKIKNELGWEPKYNFSEGLEDTVKWYLNSRDWWKPLEDGKLLSSMPWKHVW